MSGRSLSGRLGSGMFIVLGLLALFLVQATPGHAAASVAHNAVFTISNAADGNQLLVFPRAADGTLSTPVAYDTGGTGNGGSLGSQGAVVLSDNGQYAVAVNAGSDTISLFSLNGPVPSLQSVVFAQGSVPVSVTIHQNKYVYVVNDGTDRIAGFQIVRGRLVYLGGSAQPLPSGAAPGQISFTSDGRALVVTMKNTNEIVTFPVSARGIASPGVSSPSAAPTPFGFAIDSRDHAIVSEAVQSNLSSYAVSGTGAVLLDGPVPDGQGAACWVALSKDERFAFVANAATSSISTYAVAHNGDLELLASVAGQTVGGPQDLAVSNNGRFLYAVSRDGQAISEFAINNDGSLTFIGSITDPSLAAANGLAAR